MGVYESRNLETYHTTSAIVRVAWRKIEAPRLSDELDWMSFELDSSEEVMTSVLQRVTQSVQTSAHIILSSAGIISCEINDIADELLR